MRALVAERAEMVKQSFFVKKVLKRPEVLSLLGLLFLSALMIVSTDNFLSPVNMTNIARQVSINAVIAIGMTFVILTGGIDLSVGPIMSLSGTIAASMMINGLPIPLAIFLGLLVGVLFGTLNGLLVAYGRLPAIIVTLAMMEIPRGIGLIYTKGYPMSGLPDSFSVIGRGTVLGVQTPILIMLVMYILAFILLNRFPFGRYVYALGGNEEAARLSGIRVKIYKMLVFTISGFTAALSGIVLTSRLMSGQPNAGVGFELDAIAAVVLGGAAISGGKGHILGTLIGALMLGVLNNGLNLLGVSPYMQKILKGVVILLAIYISSEKKGLKKN